MSSGEITTSTEYLDAGLLRAASVAVGAYEWVHIYRRSKPKILIFPLIADMSSQSQRNTSLFANKSAIDYLGARQTDSMRGIVLTDPRQPKICAISFDTVRHSAMVSNLPNK